MGCAPEKLTGCEDDFAPLVLVDHPGQSFEVQFKKFFLPV